MFVSGNGNMRAVGGARTVANPVFVRATHGVSGSNPLKFTGTIDLGGIAPIRMHSITNTADTEYAGELVNGGLIKQDFGRLIISSENYFNGTVTINQQ